MSRIERRRRSTVRSPMSNSRTIFLFGLPATSCSITACSSGVSSLSRRWPSFPNQNWRVLFLLLIIQAFSIGISIFCFTFWVEPWMKEFHVSRREVMIAISILTYAGGFASFFAGRWIDLYPAKYVVTGGLVFMVLAMLLISAAQNMWTIWLVYALMMPACISLCGPLVAMTLVSR
ncbi:MAG: MFS transporter, partial [Chlorobiales bacterium]|nr:MFS transporter [Chlorobiales bacterium]